MWQIEVPKDAKPLGYRYLIEIFKIRAIPHFRWSYASPKWEKQKIHFNDDNLTLFIFPPSYRLSDDVFEHLEFALKYEGINLYILKHALNAIDVLDLITFIKTKPTGRYARILWYLYEKFNQVKLPLIDLKQGSYIPLLDPQVYYCGKPRRSSRHRIADNLLGDINFAPIVRKTATLEDYENRQIEKTAHELAKRYNPSLLSRAMRYLYTKETMSSWEIEREKPSTAKLAKFVGLLHHADSIGRLSEGSLVELQKAIVDPRFALDHYRDFQNYIGEEPGMGQLVLHYIPPRQEDISLLMDSLMRTYETIEKSCINAVVAASILSFLFVYLHPFEDGNGRIHRFLIHYTLARLKFTPEGIVFPISAAIARDTQKYDKVLETFSKPLMELITDFTVNDIGEMNVTQETLDYYRYIDLTPAAEYLYECVDRTISTDFKEELAFLADYDKIKRQCKEVVDMPDQKMDLFIKCVRQNDGKLSARKREVYFNMLSDEEIRHMEEAINQNAKPHHN